MKKIKIQCPAKINLGLKIVGKRPDGFHNIDSIMQTINLFDYLTISIEKNDKTEIILDGTSTEIPYDSKNIVYKSAELFLNTISNRVVPTEFKNVAIKIFIEKHIPVSAGLAGGSTDAAGTLYGLNKLFNNRLTDKQIHQLCAQLGSDLNVCLTGGKLKTTGRGEVIEPLAYQELNIHLIKPIDIGISAKEAYTKFSKNNNSLKTGRENFVNDLEWAIIDDYPELQFIKKEYPDSIMTGSGSTYYSTNKEFQNHEKYWVKNNLKTIPFGVKILEQ